MRLALRREWAAVAVTALLLMSLAACSGSSGSSGISVGVNTTPPSVNNVQPIVVDSGPFVNGQPVGFNDALYTTVTICAPGTSTCQSIDHVLVDTGSSGLRIVASQIGLNLPFIADANHNPIGNCAQFADTTYQWGPLVNVDVLMAGEVALSIPIQVVGASNFAAVPTACSAGGIAAQTVATLGANGILGVGLFRQDCGSACASTSAPPAVYFSCPAQLTSPCTAAPVAVSAQLQNPVWMFQQDNNGLAIVLPQVGATGAVSAVGSMVFGIGTRSNNGLAGARAQAADGFGNFTTTFNGVAYSSSFIDSGSGGYYFLDSSTTSLPNCAANSFAAGFYCPSTPANFTAINSGPNPNGTEVQVSVNVAFPIANALPLIASPALAFNNIGGPNPGVFDWGLPFFFGRTVFVGIEGQNTPAGRGPYWAY
ncbi:MAG: DUF3443 family protein [Acidobacteriota bacterium]